MKIDAVRKAALALPDTTEEPHHQFSSFRVKGKIFATVPPENQHIHVFVTEQDRELALAAFPDFIEKLLWGGKVVGVRVSLANANAAVAKSLVRKAHDSKLAKSQCLAKSSRATATLRPRSAA